MQQSLGHQALLLCQRAGLVSSWPGLGVLREMALVALLSRGWAARSRRHNPKARQAQPLGKSCASGSWAANRRSPSLQPIRPQHHRRRLAVLVAAGHVAAVTHRGRWRETGKVRCRAGLHTTPATCRWCHSDASGKRAEAGPALAPLHGPATSALHGRLSPCLRFWTPHPRRGQRIGEARHPGPPNTSGELVSMLAEQRALAMEALNGRGLAAGSATPLARQSSSTDADAETVSSGLGAVTPFDPFASPAGLPREQRDEHGSFSHRPGDTAPMMLEAVTPGYTPVWFANAAEVANSGPAAWKPRTRGHCLRCPSCPRAADIRSRAHRWPHARRLGDSTARLMHPRLHRSQFVHLGCSGPVHGWCKIHPSYGAKYVARAPWRGPGSLRCT